ncbi:MAG: hypothetical protein ACJ8GJ_23350 [Vitreoscilla sp.]
MTTYVLALTGDEERAADATHWARFRKARLLSVSRNAREPAPADTAGTDSIVIMAHGSIGQSEAGPAQVTRDPAALAALLVRTLDIQDGAGVVLADFDSEEFAADVVARIAALGRAVTYPGKTSRFAFSSVVRARSSRS